MKLDENQLRDWLVKEDLTAYEIAKHVDLSLQSIQNFIKKNTVARRSTVDKLNKFYLKEIASNSNSNADKGFLGLLDNGISDHTDLLLNHSDRKDIAAAHGYSERLLLSVLKRKRKVTLNNSDLVAAALMKAKSKASDMAATGHQLYNELDEYITASINDIEAHKLAQDGKY